MPNDEIRINVSPIKRPLKTLARGFATVSKDDKLVTSITQLVSGDKIDITLTDGKKQAEVD